jgi:hypothetical protein
MARSLILRVRRLGTAGRIAVAGALILAACVAFVAGIYAAAWLWGVA